MEWYAGSVRVYEASQVEVKAASFKGRLMIDLMVQMDRVMFGREAWVQLMTAH